MTLKYPLILKILLKLFQKQYNSFNKNVFLIYKKGKERGRGWSGGMEWAHPTTSTPAHTTAVTDNFSFSIVRIPHLTSNILLTIYSAFEPEILRQLALVVSVKHFAKHLRTWYLDECPNRVVISLFLQGDWIKYTVDISKHSESY